MLFKEKLKSNSKIFLDGGNGSEIAKLGGEMSPAFSALASITSPEIVIKVHEKFIDVGCDLITANTFSSTRHNLESINRGAEVKEFIIQSLKLSRQAIKNKGKEIISLDVPSGVDGTTGEAYIPAVNATTTITFLAMKKGLLTGEAVDHTGDIIFKNIGITQPKVSSDATLLEESDCHFNILKPSSHKASIKTL